MTIEEFRSLKVGDHVVTNDYLEVPGIVEQASERYVSIRWEGDKLEQYARFAQLEADYHARQMRRGNSTKLPRPRRKSKA